jgi:hypothetical protein
MSQNVCPQLIPLYQAWKDNLALMREARLRYQESGSDVDRLAFDEAREKAKTAQADYRHIAYEVLIDYGVNKLCQLETMVMEDIDTQLVRGGGNRALIRTTNGRVTYFDVSSSKCDSLDRALSLVSSLTELQELYCFSTKIDKLPKLPDSLLKLSCSSTNIDKLPELPNSLQVLDCSFTEIDKLPELPDSLQVLSCSSTNIDKLPELPDSLQVLECSSTKIDKLPELPYSLRYINILSTPAAKDPAVRAQLNAFKKSHPSATVYY